MRDEQYYALARLVKRPMRRWWAKVGSWWMLGLGVLLAFLAANKSFETLRHQTPYRNFGNQPDWYLLGNDPSEITRAVSVGIAILCALNVVSVIDRTIHQTLAFNASELRIMKYKLALLSCWPALIPFFLGELVNGYPFKLWVSYEGTTVLIMIADSIDSLLYNSIWVVWLVAMAVITSEPRWLVWALYIGGILAKGSEAIIYQFLPIHYILFPAAMDFEMSNFEKAAFGWIGLLLVYGLFYLYMIKKTKIAGGLGIVFGAGMLLGAFGTGFGVFLVDYLLSAAGYLATKFQPLNVYYHTHYEPELVITFGGYSFSRLAGPAWAIIPVLNGVFWVFAHYFAFSWLMGRDWRRKGPRCQVKGSRGE